VTSSELRDGECDGLHTISGGRNGGEGQIGGSEEELQLRCVGHRTEEAFMTGRRCEQWCEGTNVLGGE